MPNPNTTKYGDITPRQAGFSIVNLLERAMPHMMLERFGQAYPIPKNNTQIAKFRRYFLEGGTGSYSGEGGDFNVPLADTPLEEGITPEGSKLASKDYTVELKQYGDFLEFTDVIEDTHEDFPQLLREMTDILGEQAAHTVETLRFNVLKAGTNVYYSGGVDSRGDVNAPLTLGLQRRITRSLKRQNAKPITRMVSSTVNYNTQPIEAAFIALCHPDVENDVRDLPGFISVKQYGGNTEAMDGEIGSVEDTRYIRSTVFEAWAEAGGAANAGDDDVLTSADAEDGPADVYPILYVARDAYGIVPLRGKETVDLMVVQPKATNVDPLAQRGTAGWKIWNATVILQDAFMVRAEVAATA